MYNIKIQASTVDELIQELRNNYDPPIELTFTWKKESYTIHFEPEECFFYDEFYNNSKIFEKFFSNIDDANDFIKRVTKNPNNIWYPPTFGASPEFKDFEDLLTVLSHLLTGDIPKKISIF